MLSHTVNHIWYNIHTGPSCVARVIENLRADGFVAVDGVQSVYVFGPRPYSPTFAEIVDCVAWQLNEPVED